jgi:hypothetical protein
VCNPSGVELPDGSGRFLLNPQGLMWQEVTANDIVLVDGGGQVLAGRHPVESTAMFIHAAIHRIARKACVLHTHMPYGTAMSLTAERALDTRLSQNAMRFHDRVAFDAHYNGLALDATEGERIARAMQGADVVFLGNHGVIVCGSRIDHATTTCTTWNVPARCRCWRRRRRLFRGIPTCAPCGQQTRGERLQSELFFQALPAHGLKVASCAATFARCSISSPRPASRSCALPRCSSCAS